MFDPYAHSNEPLATPVEIVPAVLPRRFRDLEYGLHMVHTEVRQVQVDIVDGVFAGPKTWPYTSRSEFDAIVREEHGLPFWDELDFEFDLMIANPLAEVRNFVQAGASRLVLHIRSDGVLETFQTLVDMRRDDGDFSVAVGIALLPTDQPDILESFESQFDFIQVMGIDHIGRQGQRFNQQALFLVERLRRRYPRLPIQVDGGVTLEYAQPLVHAGANRLIVGSAIFGAKDPLKALAELRAAVAQ